MKKNKIKKSIYARILAVFFATYLLLMVGFSVFLISQEKKVVGREVGTSSLQISNEVVEILSGHIDNSNQIMDISKVKKEFVKQAFALSTLNVAEIAVFTSDYELIYHTNDYWRCSYTEYIEGNTHYTGYGLLNPKDWFSEEEVKELEGYLYANPKTEKVGGLYSYSLSIEGFWTDDEMIIPDKIYITPLYADTMDEYGTVLSSSGTRKYAYNSSYEDKENLPYFERGAILPMNKVLSNQNQTELRQIVTNQSNLIKSIQQFPVSAVSTERVNALTYRYYLVMPYKSTVTSMDNNSVYSDFWTTVGFDINIGERIFSTLTYVWISCFIIFAVASYILFRQTYKTYLKREELERQRKEMTDALAHDLKTPLSIISGYAQNLQEDIYTEKRKHYARHINENVERMDKIIRSMFEMSRLESEFFELKLEEVSLANICTEIFERYKEVCNEKHIRTLLEGDGVIKADKPLIERVLDNFIVNAIDNTPEGGRINIKILNDTLEVYNSGSRIVEEKMKEIWLPYKKGSTERSNTKGTGLGLAISKTILELHNFSYSVKNNKEGVTFWFKWL